MSSTEYKIEKTVEWLREMVRESKSRGLLVGISGGIDSAVVGALIHRALPEDSLGVILPIRNSMKDLEDAKATVEKIGLPSLTIDLTRSQERIMQDVCSELKEKALYKEAYHRMTDANLRARLRMSTLYAVANNLGYLVVGTDNAAEIHTGYFTKYGDGGVDLLPLCHLLKREVYEWARYFDLPSSVIEKAPSAGLWEGQTDEEEMGTSYSCIDDFLSGKEISSKDAEIIEALHRRSRHKRSLPAKPLQF